MKKTIAIIVVVLVALVGIAVGVNQKAIFKKNNAQKVASPRIKARNTALRYISEARMKAKQGDYKGAEESCDKAVKVAPKEPSARNCKRSIDLMLKK